MKCTNCGQEVNMDKDPYVLNFEQELFLCETCMYLPQYRPYIFEL